MFHPFLTIRLACVGLLLSAFGAAAIAAGTAPDLSWRSCVADFARDNVKHSAWGMAHSARNYALALTLAQSEQVAIDTDILYAAAYLHDLGAIDGFRKDGVDHALQSNLLIEPILAACHFPLSKLDAVKAVIASHMYYDKPGASVEARAFRDADSLDFLGAIGMVRIVSLTGRHGWAKDLPGALRTLDDFATKIPPGMATRAGRDLALARQAELRAVLAQLRSEAPDL